MRRRSALLAPWPLLAWPAAWADTAAGSPRDPPPAERLATAWRMADPAAALDAGQHVGVMRIDWAAGQVQIESAVTIPTRAHGLLALDDGGFVALANRPGRWLLRTDASGHVTVLHRLDDERPARTLNGHAEASADGHWLLTTETDSATGAGWLGLRDARTLARVAQFESHGVDPHQLLRAADGSFVVANGGIARDARGRKVDGQAMDPSLVHLDAEGRLLGRWQLPDKHSSLRHLAWAHGPAPLLGIALQAEHATAAQRLSAPTLAVWDGRGLSVPSTDAGGGGYAGDIAAGPAGGFVISAQKQGRGLWWQPAQPDEMTVVAELTEPCALAPCSDGRGVILSAGRGLALWHSRLAPRMLRWPVALAPDNHAVRLSATA